MHGADPLTRTTALCSGGPAVDTRQLCARVLRAVPGAGGSLGRPPQSSSRTPAPAARRSRRRLHRVSSNPSQPPYPRHSRRTGLRQPSLPLPQPPLALVLISHDPAAPRRCFTLVRPSITLPVTRILGLGKFSEAGPTQAVNSQRDSNR